MTAVCIHTVQAIKRALILKVDLKKNFLYMLLIAKLNAYIRARGTFPYKKRKERTRIICTLRV